MKKLLYFTIVILSSVFVSCEDFLSVEPSTSLVKDQVFDSEAGISAALTGVYATLDDYHHYAYSTWYTLMSTSGAFVSTKTGNEFDMAMTRLTLDASNYMIDNIYNAQFATIGKVNDFIYNVNQVDTSLVDLNAKNKYLGDAYFIRAMVYFNMVRQFGKLPLNTKPVANFVEGQQPRASVSDVYAQIIEDLDSAYNKLAVKGSNLSGRPHKMAAKALLAKVYVTLAGNTAGSPYWQKAYDAALEVKNSGAYSLVSQFSKLFGADNNTNNDPESIFEIQFSAVVQSNRITETTLPGYSSFTPSALTKSGWGTCRPTYSTFDLFYSTGVADGRVGSTFIYDSYSQVKDNNGVVLTTPTTVTTYSFTKTSNKTMPYLRKYLDSSFETISKCNFVYYRYADLLLLLAEAANELGNTVEAEGYVNLVLSRARDLNGNGAVDAGDATQPADWSGKSQAQFRTDIMIERRKELCGEGHEWYDVRRRGEAAFKSIIDAHNAHLRVVAQQPTYTLASTAADITRNMLFPIPESEINSNTAIPQEDQNPGY